MKRRNLLAMLAALLGLAAPVAAHKCYCPDRAEERRRRRCARKFVRALTNDEEA